MAQGLEEELRDVELVSVRLHYTSFTVSGIPQAMKVVCFYTIFLFYYFNDKEFTSPCSFKSPGIESELSAEVIGFG